MRTLTMMDIKWNHISDWKLIFPKLHVYIGKIINMFAFIKIWNIYKLQLNSQTFNCPQSTMIKFINNNFISNIRRFCKELVGIYFKLNSTILPHYINLHDKSSMDVLSQTYMCQIWTVINFHDPKLITLAPKKLCCISCPAKNNSMFFGIRYVQKKNIMMMGVCTT
jgi:hypothetical protein